MTTYIITKVTNRDRQTDRGRGVRETKDREKHVLHIHRTCVEWVIVSASIYNKISDTRQTNETPPQTWFQSLIEIRDTTLSKYNKASPFTYF